MDKRVKKMPRFVVLTAELSREMEILAEVEWNLRRTTMIFSFAGDGEKSLQVSKENFVAPPPCSELEIDGTLETFHEINDYITIIK